MDADERIKILRNAFDCALENVALSNTDDESAVVDPSRARGRDETALYLTEYDRALPGSSIKAWAGPRICTHSLERAGEIAEVLGLRVMGKLQDSFSTDLPVGEMLNRMNGMGVPESMQQDVIDRSRELGAQSDEQGRRGQARQDQV